MKTKSFLKLASAAALVAAACFVTRTASAQENITGDLLAGWATNPLANGGGAPPANFPSTSGDANVTVGPLQKGSGITAITTAGVYGGAGWTNAPLPDSEANSIANGLYLTYTVKPNAGYTVSFTTNILYFHNSATGPIQGELQYSFDGLSYTDAVAVTYSATHAAQTTSVTNTLSGVAALQNIAPLTTVYFRLVNWGANGTAGTWYINNGLTPLTLPDFQVIGTISSAGVAPFNLSVTPSSAAVNAGGTAAFTVTAQGDTPSYFWYKNSTANLIAGATTATLTLPNVSGGDAANYFVVVSNVTGMATSSPVTLTVTDPFITSQPVSTYGLVDGTVQFAVTGAGTSPSYQWYFATVGGSIVAPVQNITQVSGSIISGAASSTLQIANLQLADATNFVAIVSNSFGTVTSAVASLVGVGTHEQLTFWNFNQTNFPSTLVSPAPWFGVGTALPVGVASNASSPFAGSVDPGDGLGFGLGTTNGSWGTSGYPVSGSNKTAGIQFMVSTVGAQNVTFSYQARVSATASDYYRVQYSTNAGVNWVDYPSSSTMNSIGSTYIPFTNNLTGFPGVANNPAFGLRVVSEFQSTASYGVSANAAYLGTANTYGTGGTVTYDIVSIWGDSITTAYNPPVLNFPTNNVTMPDTTPFTINFTVADANPATLTYSAVSLNSTTVNPGFLFGGTGTNRTLQITPNSTPDVIDAAPILITITDSSGFSAASWFDLTLTSPNLPPTNSLATIGSTNVLANSSAVVPFKVTDDRTPANGQSFSYTTTSTNNTVLPTGRITLPPTSPNSNVTLTLTPVTGQLGIAQIGIQVNDNDLLDAKTSTANFNVMVRPNTNVIFVDYFNYDNSGPIGVNQANIWGHLSGTRGQMQVAASPTGGYVTVDTFDNSENLQATLLGAPYLTNSGGTLYASYIVNMDGTKMPSTNGSYFTVFNDGSGVTGNYECRVLAATNGAAPGLYRLGIVNFGSDSTDGQMFPLDLTPGSNYVVVTSLLLTNGVSTIWINPAGQSSLSVTDLSGPSNPTNILNISAFELRESGGVAGSVKLSHLKVGKTFDSVFPSLGIAQSGANVVLSASDPTIGIQSSTNVVGPYTDVSASNPYTNAAGLQQTYYRLGQ